MGRLVLAVIVLAAIPVAATLPALLSLAVLSVAVTVAVGVETWRHADFRDEVRHHDEQ